MNDLILLMFGVKIAEGPEEDPDISRRNYIKWLNHFFSCLTAVIFYYSLFNYLINDLDNLNSTFESYYILLSHFTAISLLIVSHHLTFYYFTSLREDVLKHVKSYNYLRKYVNVSNSDARIVTIAYVIILCCSLMIYDSNFVNESFTLVNGKSFGKFIFKRIENLVLKFYEVGWVYMILFQFIYISRSLNRIDFIENDDNMESYASRSLSVHVSSVLGQITKWKDINNIKVKFGYLYGRILLFIFIFTLFNQPEMDVKILSSFVSIYEQFWVIILKILLLLVIGFIGLSMTFSIMKEEIIRGKICKKLTDLTYMVSSDFERNAIKVLSMDIRSELYPNLITGCINFNSYTFFSLIILLLIKSLIVFFILD